MARGDPDPSRFRRLRAIAAAGTRRGVDEDDARRIWLTNMSGLIGTVVNYGYVIIYAVLGWWPIVAFNSVAGLGYPATLWLNARGHNRAASLILLTCVCAQVTAVPNVFLGPATGIHYFLFVITPTAFMLLARRDVAWAVVLSALSLGCFAATEYLPQPLGTAIDVGPAAARVLHVSSTTVTILVIAIIVYLSYAGLESAQARLRAAKKAAEDSAEQMRRDLEAAARVQAALLPNRLPEDELARFAWIYRPSEHLGGDLLNIFRLDDRHIGMYVLDASGHGVQAALLSVAVSRSLSPRADRSSLVLLPGSNGSPGGIASPADVARQLNALYPFDGPTGQFMTLVYAVLNTRSGECRYICAGHPGPLHVRASGEGAICHAPALPIGIQPDADYRDSVLQLAPRDRLYLFSDGLLEQISAEGEPFGLERVQAITAAHRAAPLHESAGRLMESLLDWRGQGSLRDDVSIVAAEFMGAESMRTVRVALPEAAEESPRG